MPSPTWIKKRSDFLKVQSGKRYRSTLFVLCTRTTKNITSNCDTKNDSFDKLAALRFGITVTKKQGNSVERNRIRRRIKALLQQFLLEQFLQQPLSEEQFPAHNIDLVIIGHSGILTQSYESIKVVLFRALLRALGINPQNQLEQISAEKNRLPLDLSVNSGDTQQDIKCAM